jgi:hypothetical protein
MSVLAPNMIALALGVAVLLSAARLLLRRPSRWPLRLLLSAAAAAALYWVLLPPSQPLPRAGALTVLSADWQGAQASLGPLQAVVALPEAGEALPAGVTRVPDLATALRARPQFEGLRLLGRGLPARDHEVARGRLLDGSAAALPDGLQALELTAAPNLGDDIVVRGRWQGPPPARLQLLDSEGGLLAEQALDAAAAAAPASTNPGLSADSGAEPEAGSGADTAAAAEAAALPRSDEGLAKTAGPDAGDSAQGVHAFVLRTPARAVGEVLLRLVAVDAEGAARPLLDLPLSVRAPRALNVQLLAGAPGPELKSLRRWAVDAGLTLDSRIQFAPGLIQSGTTSGPRGLGVEAAALAELDLLIVDERAWAALGPAGRATALAAVDEGLGLLLRLSAVPGPMLRTELAAIGFDVAPTEAAPTLRLSGSELRLRRLPVEVQAADAAALVEGDTGAPAGLWRARGQGRIGLLWLLDSFRLVGTGEGQAHAALWAQLSAILARAPSAASEASRPSAGSDSSGSASSARSASSVSSGPSGSSGAFEPSAVSATGAAESSAAPISMTAGAVARAWRGERFRLCGPVGAVTVRSPDGELTALAAADAEGCRALWPRASGLHRIELGDGAQMPLQVLEPTELQALHAADLAEATRALQAQALLSESPGQTLSAPGTPWPWLGLLLVLLAALWWLERPRPAA